MGNWQIVFDERDRSWIEHAACRGMGAHLFYPEDKTRNSNRQAATAKKICAQCPVQEQCLEYGLGENFGIWGATSVRDRRSVRRNIKGAA